ncbi:hypothetical protein DFH27DRAFT_603023 [Peziza echinospora]|nr:hypothetical protein DFH27DRAFT_603023 [Peziza echinospora]
MGSQILNEIRQLRTHLVARLSAICMDMVDAQEQAETCRRPKATDKKNAENKEAAKTASSNVTCSYCSKKGHEESSCYKKQREAGGAATFNALLGAFGLPVGGLVVNRRRMFKKYIGVVAAPI